VVYSFCYRLSRNFRDFTGIRIQSIFERYMQPLLAVVYILAGGGIICIIVIAPTQVIFYYAGLMLVFIWGFTLSSAFGSSGHQFSRLGARW